MILTNKNQKKIVKLIQEKIQEFIQNTPPSEVSSTFAPYYDIIIDEKQKSNLQEVKMSQIVSDKVKAGTAKTMIKTNSQNVATLIKFMPKKSEKSEILNDYQISNLIENFPNMMMTMNWTLLFSINRDGVSVGTFFEKCKGW